MVVQQQLTLWFRDLEDAMAEPAPEELSEDDIEEAFTLYRKAQKIVGLGNAFSRWVTGGRNRLITSEPVNFSLAPAFEGVVKAWLDKTVMKTRQWADQVSART